MIRPHSIIAAALLSCGLATTVLASESAVFNPFLRGPHQGVPPPAPATNDHLRYEEAFNDAAAEIEIAPPTTVYDLVEPLPESGPSYRPRRKAVIEQPVTTTAPAEAVASEVKAHPVLEVIPLGPPETASTPSSAPAPALPVSEVTLVSDPAVAPEPAAQLPQALKVILPPPLRVPSDSQASATVQPSNSSEARAELKDEAAREARKERCKAIEYKGKQLTVIPPTSSTFSLPFKGLKGCLTAVGAQESWIEVTDSRSDAIEFFADENTTGENRRAAIHVVTPSETMEIRVLQRKYDRAEKPKAKAAK